jgi:dTMP kinase
MGLFITFEGSEGSGKTTQIRKAADYLKGKGVSCIVTEEPGGTSLGNELRKLLLNRSSLRITGKSELLLFSAARAQHVEEVILPAINEGTMVLCDRYSDATVAYQGFGRGVEISDVRWINDFASQHLQPDLTLFFNLPGKAGLGRARGRIANMVEGPAEDRFESEDLDFHMRVWEGYYTLIKEEPGRFRVIDASKGIDEVYRDVCQCLDGVLGHSK